MLKTEYRSLDLLYLKGLPLLPALHAHIMGFLSLSPNFKFRGSELDWQKQYFMPCSEKTNIWHCQLPWWEAGSISTNTHQTRNFPSIKRELDTCHKEHDKCPLLYTHCPISICYFWLSSIQDLYILYFKNKISSGWCGSMDWVPAFEPKGCWFDS